MTEKDSINEINEKMDTMLSALQNFGMSMIQNIGNLKHDLIVMTDKVEKLNTNLIYIKSLGPKITELSKSKEHLTSELKYIQSLIKAGNLKKNQQILITTEKENLHSPRNILISLQKRINDFHDIKSLISDIELAKKEIFTITGGHRTLFEINTEIKKLKKKQDISQEILEDLEEKITFWINKFDS
ncbi:MAG: hypothetical protein ACTSWY_12485 [Promethearchaeota archaeon]